MADEYKPKIFIASSVEGISYAYAVQENLEHDAHVTTWSQGVFGLSDTPIDSLLDALEAADFGIFIFSPDDELSIRGDTHTAVRDNVIFELGLFIGQLGKNRSFIVMPQDNSLHIPTDLTGITPAKYPTDRPLDELVAALGPSCNKIRQKLRIHGPKTSREKPESISVTSLHENYSLEDRKALLKSWLFKNKDNKNRQAIKFKDIDNELGIEKGSSAKLLPDIIEGQVNFSVDSRGDNVISFKYSKVIGRLQ